MPDSGIKRPLNLNTIGHWRREGRGM